jgi:hypothetical protein
MGPLDEHFLIKFAEFVKALQDNPHLRELLGSALDIVPSYNHADGRVVVHIHLENHHYHGDNVTNQQHINAQNIDALVQDNGTSAAINSPPIRPRQVVNEERPTEQEELLAPPRAAIHVEAARQVHLVALSLVGLLSLAAIATGVVALVLDSNGNTQFKFLGADLNTASVGVACLAIGLISLVLTVRRVLKSVETLAALPPDGFAIRTRRRR